jgi:hypothetical protein
MHSLPLSPFRLTPASAYKTRLGGPGPCRPEIAADDHTAKTAAAVADEVPPADFFEPTHLSGIGDPRRRGLWDVFTGASFVLRSRGGADRVHRGDVLLGRVIGLGLEKRGAPQRSDASSRAQGMLSGHAGLRSRSFKPRSTSAPRTGTSVRECRPGRPSQIPSHSGRPSRRLGIPDRNRSSPRRFRRPHVLQAFVAARSRRYSAR